MTVPLRQVDDATAEALRRHWYEGWNRGDVDLIMEPFAEDVVFSSPFVTRLTGDPDDASIVGRDALRSYVEGALNRTPGIRYTVEGLYTGTDGIVLVYTCDLPDGSHKAGADTMRLDSEGRIVDWRSHYAGER